MKLLRTGLVALTLALAGAAHGGERAATVAFSTHEIEIIQRHYRAAALGPHDPDPHHRNVLTDVLLR
jgi:hypothetical protein